MTMKLPMPFPNPTTYKGHAGFDYGVPYGTPIRSGADGVITRSEWFNNRSGFMRELTHDNGISERSYHLRDLTGPKIGETVKAGEVWAISGNTGTVTTGPHLHHEVWLRDWLRAGDAYWLYMDRDRYVGQGAPADVDSTPFPTDQEQQEEEEMSTIKFGHRNEPGYGDEWMIVHPDLRGERDHERGYLVTTSRERATAWGRLYGKGSNDYAFDVSRADYIELQAAAREAYDAVRRAEADALV